MTVRPCVLMPGHCGNSLRRCVSAAKAHERHADRRDRRLRPYAKRNSRCWTWSKTVYDKPCAEVPLPCNHTASLVRSPPPLRSTVPLGRGSCRILMQH
jgi:hypothetical protein